MTSVHLTGSTVAALPAVVAANYQGVPVTLALKELGRRFLELETEAGKLTKPSDIVKHVAGLVPDAKLFGASDADRSAVESWIDFAYSDILNEEVEKIFHHDGQLLRALLNMGVFYSGLQDSVRNALSGCEPLNAALSKLDSHLTNEMFLVAGRITAADIAVAACLYDIHNLVFEKEVAFPNVTRWFKTVVNQKAFQSAYDLGLLTGGSVREGGQIDLRPNPIAVAAAADSSIALNAGQKKAETQRQAEKKKKEAVQEKKEATSTPSSGSMPGNGKVPATAAQPETNLSPLGKQDAMSKTAKLLDSMGISHKTVEHDAAPDVSTLLQVAGSVEGAHCKNLLLKAKKKRFPEDTQLWLLVALHDTPTDLKEVAQKLGYGKIVIRFADDKTLLTNLGVAKGSVTPFALVNDTALQVNVALDSRMLKEPRLSFHPLTNEASTSIKAEDLVTFISNTGHNVTLVDF